MQRLLIFAFLPLLFAQCTGGKTTIQQQALRITRLLDSSSIQVFKTWNYMARGHYGVWTKVACDNNMYSLYYSKQNDTSYLAFSQPFNVMQDFACSMAMDTAKFTDFRFDLFNNKIFRITFVDSLGREHITGMQASVQKIFPAKNPFETLDTLLALKQKLGVQNIQYWCNLGGFIQFTLPEETMLTWLPDGLFTNNKLPKPWLQDFAKGTMIKKHWNLRTYTEGELR